MYTAVCTKLVEASVKRATFCGDSGADVAGNT